MVLSAISIAIVATMHLAVTFRGYGFRLPSVGPILMLDGAVGIVVSAIVMGMLLSSEKSHRTLDRQVTDLHGGLRSVHQEIEQPTLRVLSSATTRPPGQILPARGTSNRTNDFLIEEPRRRTCEV
jgi:hypothetical protein